jgi:hypothetical protein
MICVIRGLHLETQWKPRAKQAKKIPEYCKYDSAGMAEASKLRRLFQNFIFNRFPFDLRTRKIQSKRV